MISKSFKLHCSSFTLKTQYTNKVKNEYSKYQYRAENKYRVNAMTIFPAILVLSLVLVLLLSLTNQFLFDIVYLHLDPLTKYEFKIRFF